MTSQFILLAIGSRGDVDPLKETAAELTRRGRNVLIVTLPSFSEECRALGLRTVVAPPELVFPLKPKSNGILDWIAGRSLSDWKRGRDIFHARTRWLFEFIHDHHLDGDTVVVARSGLAGARIARELLDIRLCTVHHTPASFRSRLDNHRFSLRGGAAVVRRTLQDGIWRATDVVVGMLLQNRLNAFRSTFGLPPVRRLFDVWGYSPDLNLGLFPSWYAAPQSDWPPNSRLTGFPSGGLALADDILPEPVRRFISEGEPPVVISYGAHEDRGANLERIVAKLTSAGAFRAIFLGRENPAFPSNTQQLYCKFVPLRAILPHSRALVHHGGIGTMASALATGTPQVVVPVVGDQWDQARRAVALGCARMLKRHQLEAQLGDTISQVTSSPEIQSACRDVRAKMTGKGDGIDSAADWLETLADRPQMLPAKDARRMRATTAFARFGSMALWPLFAPALLWMTPFPDREKEAAEIDWSAACSGPCRS